MKILNNIALTFDDVLLVPRCSDIKSRFSDEISLQTKLLPNITLQFPILSANMDTVTEGRLAKELQQLGGLGIVHRFMSTEEHKQELEDFNLNPAVACIGVGENGLKRLEYLSDICEAVLIDIAHGHSVAVFEQIQKIRKRFPQISIIAGNVATPDAAEFLSNAGAHCIKIGVGPGSICSTRIQTGNGVPQITAISEIAKRLEGTGKTIIADGGIKNAGDIVKALAAGAHAVMLGSLFAGTHEAPGEVFSSKGTPHKIYRGSASREAQSSWKKTAKSIEGVKRTIPFKGPVELVFKDLIYNILSGMSYQGATNLEELRRNAVFVRQTSAGAIESNPHGLL
jgi:IMP dehydrogenase